MSQNSPLRLGIAGLGTVGTGVVKIIRQQAALLSARAGRDVVISAVSARDQSRDRGVSLSGYAWETDAVALAKRDDVDVFVELIGGDTGVAKAAVEAALALGKDVVTANKALLAHHGQALAQMAEANDSITRLPSQAAFQ
jgi:homoserine dehydrogenase